MYATKADIIARLQKEILPLQGLKKVTKNDLAVPDLGPVNDSFPNKEFPIGAVHEFCCDDAEGIAATSGFISGLLSVLMKKGGATLWISASRRLFPPSLVLFGIDPTRVIFIDVPSERNVLWATEEALKCKGLSAVVAELPAINFTASRRLQLMVEQSGVTGFLICHKPAQLGTTACVSRWKITSIPSIIYDNLPGIGFPCWQVALMKIRNGKPGLWTFEWQADHFNYLPVINDAVNNVEEKKVV